MKSVAEAALGPAQYSGDGQTIHPHSTGTKCLWRNFIRLMETTAKAPVIYLPENPLNKATALINPNCGNSDTILDHQPPPGSYSHKLHFEWSAKIAIQNKSILLLGKNDILASSHISRKHFIRERLYHSLVGKHGALIHSTNFLNVYMWISEKLILELEMKVGNCSD